MQVNQAFRFKLDPSAAQRRALAKHVGAARFAYNWGLSLCLEALGEKRHLPSARELHRIWNRWKHENAPWWVEISKRAPQEAFRDLERAFRNWHQGLAGKPRFRKKKHMDDNKAGFTGSTRIYAKGWRTPAEARSGGCSSTRQGGMEPR